MREAFAATVKLGQAGELALGSAFAERYEVLALLGEGGMGRVYRARDRELEEEIAIKILRPEIASSPDALVRFRREVKLARKVTHPNVARMFDCGISAGTRFLTMELIEGRSLADALRDRRPSLVDTLRIVGEIARGLAAAHRASVIHRDLKPENVMIESGADERVVITDFGIARAKDEDQARATRAIIGTPGYMSPEQVEGKALDGRSDVFSLGVLAFEMLTGRLPFESDTAVGMAALRLTQSAPDVRTMEASVPENVAQLVAAMLARKPQDRLDALGVTRRMDSIRGVGGGHLPELSTRVLAAPPEQRELVVALLPLACPAGPAWLGPELSSRCADALTKLRSVRVIPPAAITERDPLAAGRALSAQWVIEGSIMTSGERVRARLGLVDVARGAQAEAARVEGTLADSFQLEDELASAVERWIQPRAASVGQRGPHDPRAMTAYQRALEGYRSFSVPGIESAIATLEEALREHPTDPYLTSALAAALLRKCLLLDSDDRPTLDRADDLAQRAIAIDPDLPEALETIGTLRWHAGELRDAAASYREALSRAPNLQEPQVQLASLLYKTADFEEGVRRLQRLQRAQPKSVIPWLYEAVAISLSDPPRALEIMRRAEEATGHKTGFYMLRWRLAVWHGRREVAAEVASVLAEPWMQQEPVFSRVHAPLVPLFVERDLERADVELKIEELLRLKALPLTRYVFLQHATELAAAARWDERALELLDRLSRGPFIDVAWMDRVPLLARLRESPSFAASRARVAARAEQLWT